jgi:hypothetical protein
VPQVSGFIKGEAHVKTSFVKCVLFVSALLISALPVSAQSSFGVGVSFLGDERGTGLVLDYSSALAGQSGDSAVGWVGEFALNHKGFGGALAGVEGGATTIMAQLGVRMSGKAGDKVSWLGHGLVGLMRTGFGVEAAGLNREFCELYNIDCSSGNSDTGGVLTIGGGVQYAMTDSTHLRGQLDFPIALGAEGGGTTRFSIMLAFSSK